MQDADRLFTLSGESARVLEGGVLGLQATVLARLLLARLGAPDNARYSVTNLTRIYRCADTADLLRLRAFDDWTKLLANVVAVTPLLCVLTHYGQPLKLGGKNERPNGAAAH